MITDPKMLDIAILELNAAMLANISWLSNAYGKIEHLKEVEEGTEKTYPAVYIGKNEYLKLFPDDELGSFSYIDIRDTNDVSEMQRISLETVTELSIVFWFDYRQVSPSDADGTTIENVKYELAQFILRYGFQTFSFEIQSFSEQVDNVYNGLSHEVIKNQFNMRPYGCLKITGQLRHRQRCGNVTNPIVTLPVSPVISLKTINGESIEGGGDIEIRGQTYDYTFIVDDYNPLNPTNGLPDVSEYSEGDVLKVSYSDGSRVEFSVDSGVWSVSYINNFTQNNFTSSLKSKLEDTNEFTDREKNKLNDLYVSVNEFTGSDREKLQSALDFVNSEGGGVVLVPSKTTLIITRNPNGAADWNFNRGYGVRVYSNTRLIIDGVVRLADDQDVGTGVDNSTGIISCGLVENVVIEGNGIIDGNASGQINWTDGYQQINATVCISIGVVSVGTGINGYDTNKNIIIEGLSIINTLANPIVARNTENLKIININSDDVGEGIEINKCKNVTILGLIQKNTNNTIVGDGFEVSSGLEIQLKNFQIENIESGGAIDFFGVDGFIIDGGIITDCVSGIDLHDANGASYDPGVKNGIISNVVIKNITNDGLTINLDPSSSNPVIENILISDVSISNCGRFGIAYFLNDNYNNGLVRFNSVIVTNCISDGFQGKACSFEMYNCVFSDNGRDGIQLYPTLQANSASNIDKYIVDCTLSNNSRYGLYLNWSGVLTNKPKGLFNIIAKNNLGLVGNAALEGLQALVDYRIVENGLQIYNKKSIRTTNQIDPYVTGLETLYTTNPNIRKIQSGTNNQILDLVFNQTTLVQHLGTSISNIVLSSGANESFSDNSTLKIRYNATDELWYEVSKTNL